MARILVIEDESSVREDIRREISAVAGDHALAECDTVQEGLRLVASVPELIVLDMTPRDTNGAAFMVFYNRMLKAGTLPEIPVVLMSASSYSEMENLRVTYTSVKELVRKPLAAGELQQAIARCLQARG